MECIAFQSMMQWKMLQMDGPILTFTVDHRQVHRQWFLAMFSKYCLHADVQYAILSLDYLHAVDCLNLKPIRCLFAAVFT